MSGERMRAVVVDTYGEPEVMRVREVERPRPGDGEVLVRVHAASVNPVDAEVRSGRLRLLTAWRRPLVLGGDFAGEVVAVGDGVERLASGDRVFGMVSPAGGGAYAAFVAASTDGVARIPDALRWADAAACPIVAVTALQALRDKGRLRAGGRVLVNGASGGVGTVAVQIARALGAGEVVATARAETAERLRSLGVDRVIDYREVDFTEEDTAYDIVFDAAGKSSYRRARAVLTADGAYVTTRPDPENVVARVVTLFTEQDAAGLLVQPSAEDLRAVVVLIEQGRIRPVVDRTFPLDAAAAAHRHLDEGHPFGKVVLTLE